MVAPVNGGSVFIPGASSAITDTSRRLAEIEAELAKEAERAKKSGALAAKQAQIEVETFEKTVRKSPFTTAGSATDIGVVQKDMSRLNVFSTLQKTDSVDHYRFRVQTGGEITMGMIGDEGLRVEVMTRFGAVVADSKEGTGKKNENFEAMRRGEFRMNAGEYVIRVTRLKPPEEGKDRQNYGISLSQGVYRRDYDTIAQAPRPGDGVPQPSAAMQNLQGMLTASSSFVSSLPPIGTSARSKLMGSLFG